MSNKDWMDMWDQLKALIYEELQTEMVQSIAVLPEDKDKAEIHKAKYDTLRDLIFAMSRMEREEQEG